MLEGAWQMTLTHTVTALRIGNQIISALVDGAEATLERAANLLTWAKAEGKIEVLETVEATQPSTIGKRAAQALHIDLSRLRYTHTAHYEVSSAAVSRELLSLTELTEAEVAVVWSHACLIRGYCMPVTRYYGKSVAA
ncbi:hypothetical protein Q0M94_19905 (plasmid) [Deinococcus radiomollis]|uniref:hypothetical protein n=1 Tax=Deinococcus radiomollis TaxID=468916 RepID=UPI0038915210